MEEQRKNRTMQARYDEGSLGELIALYREKLIRYIASRIDNTDIAEELAEDTFVELLAHPHRYRGECGVKTYLFAIARHKLIDHLRKKSRLEQLELTEDISSSAPLPEDMVCADEEKRELRSALAQLSVSHRDYYDALYLFYFEDMSTKEVARIMKKSVKQTENLLYRGKIALAAKMKGVSGK